MVRWLQARFGLRRSVAAIGPLFILLAVLAAIGFAAKTYLLPQINSLLADQSILERFLNTLFRGHAITVGGKSYSAHEAAQVIIASLRANIDPSQAMADIAVVVAAVMGAILTLVLFMYFLVDGRRIADGMLWVMPPGIRPQALAVARKAGPIIRSYVRGILIITAYATALSFVATRFVLHVQNALILSIAVGVLELVPVMGPILAVVLLAFVTIEQITFWRIVGVALFTTVLRVSIDQFVGPMVLGRVVKVPPPLIIFSFMAGGAIWGVLGVFIAIPAAAIIKVVLEEAYREKTV
jgi:predicted PurR-regulated permease PerM